MPPPRVRRPVRRRRRARRPTRRRDECRASHPRRWRRSRRSPTPLPRGPPTNTSPALTGTPSRAAIARKRTAETVPAAVTVVRSSGATSIEPRIVAMTAVPASTAPAKCVTKLQPRIARAVPARAATRFALDVARGRLPDRQGKGDRRDDRDCGQRLPDRRVDEREDADDRKDDCCADADRPFGQTDRRPTSPPRSRLHRQRPFPASSRARHRGARTRSQA